MKTMHVIRGNALVIGRNICKMLIERDNECKISIFDAFNQGEQSVLHQNQDWISLIPVGQFSGVLKKTWQLARFKGSIGYLLNLIVGDFTILSLMRLVIGPRRIIFHGCILHPITLLILKAFGKHLVFIHWGGIHITHGRSERLVKIHQLFYRLYSKIIVLMSPETKYFNNFNICRVKVLPYPNLKIASSKIDDVKSYLSSIDKGSILIGNSAWYTDSYYEFASKCSPNSFHRMTFMLAYGGYDDKEIKKFVEYGTMKYGDVFDAWTEVISYEDYISKLKKYEYYLCALDLQTGLGAICISILTGKTLILRGDNYKWLSDIGIRVLNFDDFEEFSSAKLGEHRLSNDVKVNNALRLISLYKNEYSQNKWFEFINNL